MKNTHSRHLYRFGIRTMLFLVLAIAIWLGILTNNANRQRRAVNVISESGSFVYYHEFPFERVGKVDYAADPPGPAWVRRLIGDHYSQTVRHVNFSPTDEAMKQLASLPHLDQISLDAYQLTDKGLEELSSLRKLRRLSIANGHALSNGSMATLPRLPKLEMLIIHDTPIDGRSLEHLAKLSNLDALFLGGTRLTEDDLIRLRALLPNASIDVNPEMPPYQRPENPKPQNLPYSEYRGTSLDRRK